VNLNRGFLFTVAASAVVAAGCGSETDTTSTSAKPTPRQAYIKTCQEVLNEEAYPNPEKGCAGLLRDSDFDVASATRKVASQFGAMDASGLVAFWRGEGVAPTKTLRKAFSPEKAAKAAYLEACFDTYSSGGSAPKSDLKYMKQTCQSFLDDTPTSKIPDTAAATALGIADGQDLLASLDG